jgi:predicted O-linked N-acetylglucosamine transferase (SPINDLY family)
MSHATDALSDRILAHAAQICATPNEAHLYKELGDLALETGLAVSAIRLFLQAWLASPGKLDILLALSSAYLEIGDAPQSASLAKIVADHDPKSDLARVLLGRAWQALANPGADDAFKSALEINAGNIQAWAGLIDSTLSTARLDIVQSQIETALVKTNNAPEIQFRRSTVLSQLGQTDEAIELQHSLLNSTFSRADLITIIRAYLCAINYSSRLEPSALLPQTQEALARLPKVTWARPAMMPAATRPDGRLRIAYVSGDLYQHSVARNLVPLIGSHDRQAFHVSIFSDVRKPDPLTQSFAQSVDRFTPVAHLNDDRLADLIADSDIDILLVIAGRFDRNRFQLCARRIAPIQISFHDVATSGLAHMDYLLADADLVQPAFRHQFCERLLRLPRFYLHQPMDLAPDPGSSPQARNNFLTFGCFNNPMKMSDSILALWSRILHDLPNAKLMLKYKDAFVSPALRARITNALNIDPARIRFLNPTIQNIGDHLLAYRDIDVALDTAPFCGSTTTFEAVAMGVPVLTLESDRMVGNWSKSILKGVGLGQFVAKDSGDFIRIAQACDTGAIDLADIRASLRARLNQSSMCDGRRRARQVERLLHAVWRRHQNATVNTNMPESIA